MSQMNSQGPDEAFELSSICSKGYEADLQCPVCEKIYNFSYRAPLTLPCGHDVCSKEVEIFKMKKFYKCPTCNTQHESSSPFKMNLPILTTIHSLYDIMFCKVHKDKFTEVCLYDRKLLCAKCLTDSEHLPHKRESLKVFLEKMRETRKWRKETEERIVVPAEDLKSLLEEKRKELIKKLETSLKETTLSQEKKEAIFAKLEAEINEFFEGMNPIDLNKYIAKNTFAQPNKFIELDLNKDIDYGVYQLDIEDLKTELERWTFRVKKSEILKGFSEKLKLVNVKTGSSEEDFAFEYKNQEFKFEFKRFLQGEYDLISGLISGITGIMYLKKRKNENALEAFKKSRAMMKAYFEPNHPLIGRCYYGIGASHAIIGQSDQTYKYQEKAIAIFQKINEYYTEIGDCYHSLASACRGTAQYEDSLKHLWKAIEIKKKNYGEDHFSLVPIYNAIGNIFRVQMKYKEAYELHKKALEISLNTYGPHHPLVADSYDDMGVTQTYLLNTESALEYLLKALEIRKKYYGEMHQTVANSYNNLGLVYKIENNLQDALETYKHSLRIRQVTMGDQNASTATVYNNMGVIYRNLNDYPDSILCHERALEIRKKIFGDKNLEVAKTYNAIGKTYTAKGDRDKAKENFHQAYSIAKEIIGESHPDTQKYFRNYTKMDDPHGQNGEKKNE